jgi:hypothetical protein
MVSSLTGERLRAELGRSSPDSPATHVAARRQGWNCECLYHCFVTVNTKVSGGKGNWWITGFCEFDDQRKTRDRYSSRLSWRAGAAQSFQEKKGKAIGAGNPPAEPAIRRHAEKTAEPSQLRINLRCLGLGG